MKKCKFNESISIRSNVKEILKNAKEIFCNDFLYF
jgi:hypothetical protein